VPLLDHRLVEFAATLPAPFRLRDGVTKYLFKRAMRGILPDAVIDRRKQGFAIPLGRWFRGELERFVHDLLLSETSRRRGLFNERYVLRLLEWHRRGRPLDLQLWTLISFELWCRLFLDSRTPRFARTGDAGRRSRAVERRASVPA
jgi:asparagine synthase (glutamine-hydrolysing)